MKSLLVLSLMGIIALIIQGGISTVYAQGFGTTVDSPIKEASFFDKLRFWMEDRWESINPNARAEIGINERRGVLDDLKNGFEVAQERIDRVKERLGDEAVDEIVRANEINKIHDEFLEIREIDDPVERNEKATELENEINSMTLIKQGCERPIDIHLLLDDPNYYETLRTDYCSKTLGEIDNDEAVEILQRVNDDDVLIIPVTENCPSGFVRTIGEICVEKDDVFDRNSCPDGFMLHDGKCISTSLKSTEFDDESDSDDSDEKEEFDLLNLFG